LFKLGFSLGAIGQMQDACVTLAEVGVRFPAATVAADATQAMAELGCS
jgi:TolA-binding protein